MAGKHLACVDLAPLAAYYAGILFLYMFTDASVYPIALSEIVGTATKTIGVRSPFEEESPGLTTKFGFG